MTVLNPKIQLTKPALRNWRLQIIDTSESSIAAFDLAVQEQARQIGIDESRVSKYLGARENSTVWELCVEPFQAIYLAYIIGRYFGLPTEIWDIGV